MQNKINNVSRAIYINTIQLSKAEKIRKEIQENVKYHLYDDSFILL